MPKKTRFDGCYEILSEFASKWFIFKEPCSDGSQFTAVLWSTLDSFYWRDSYPENFTLNINLFYESYCHALFQNSKVSDTQFLWPYLSTFFSSKNAFLYSTAAFKAFFTKNSKVAKKNHKFCVQLLLSKISLTQVIW